MTNRIALALPLSCVLAACSSVGDSNLESRSTLNSIVEKQTTAAEVRSLLGNPAYISTDVGGDTVWAYRHYKGGLFGNGIFTSVILRIRDGQVLAKNVSRF